jgi:hypothetical protein
MLTYYIYAPLLKTLFALLSLLIQNPQTASKLSVVVILPYDFLAQNLVEKTILNPIIKQRKMICTCCGIP